MPGRASRGLLLVVLLAFGLGCKQQMSPLALNNFASANNRKIAKAATEVRQKLELLRIGKNVPPAEIRSSIDNLRRTVADVRTETNKVGPDYLPEANDFYAAYQGFLDGQENLLNDEFSKITKIVEGQGGAGQKWKEIAPILARIEKADAADLSRLQEVQKRMAQPGGFLPPGGYY